MPKAADGKRVSIAAWAALAMLALALAVVSFPAFAAERPSSPSEVERALDRDPVSLSPKLGEMDADSAGTVFTFTSPIESMEISGDLYWAGQRLELEGSRVGNDVMALALELELVDSRVSNDVRVAGQTANIANLVVQGNVDVVAFDVAIDQDSAATGYYCGGGSISYSGFAKRFIAYGQSIYFDGVVEGDVTLSAQDIVIGPNAKVTGTMDIRSGQNLEVLSIPESAEIAHIDTTLNQPNTIDQITQIRAAVAPYFQVGSLLFVVVSFILMGLAFLWGFANKLNEANRLARGYPLAILVLACIALMLMFVAVMLGTLLVFTIPFSAVVLLFLLISSICCVPFTGASLMLMLGGRVRPFLCVVLGSGIGGALLFVPYVNIAVFLGSLIYFVGYLVNIAMFGHDREHDASFHVRGTSEHEEAHGKGHGILPIAPDDGSGIVFEESARDEDAGAAAADDDAAGDLAESRG